MTDNFLAKTKFSLEELFMLNEITPTFMRYTFPNTIEYISYEASHTGIWKLYPHWHQAEIVTHDNHDIVRVMKEDDLNFDIFVPSKLLSRYFGTLVVKDHVKAASIKVMNVNIQACTESCEACHYANYEEPVKQKRIKEIEFDLSHRDSDWSVREVENLERELEELKQYKVLIKATDLPK